ncbi:hypothetical protein DICPUDRAFT_77520 [Dictyostelium purpureum]|uniref:Uncharacterized protein n=1 Tax=Dictyostelium purpureum TaxID=5786 RepID=F0ZGV0_DICPU|nr:uncharacterized protein DICPUDRAFT_77520 [Dictyostelium purpureum]EGC36840.1 hypothetical protein DICPUDRAFT_77520 [Dictyostelium purpureum]|eukprot:XP_003286638.1 hypothetical protein DICPUDRAFT_77520 [Dictyostelium purpureum]
MSNKLSSIYQALDSGNNKGALKLCNALLLKKKDENTNAVKVLKAITLAKLNQIEEAISCADEMAFTGINNETVLSNLNYFYKSVQKVEKMTKVYEASYKANPKSIQLAKGCFLAYVKDRDLKQQQQMIISLQKQFPSEEHSLWYLMTILSMIQDNPTPLLLGLSQKMAEKLVSEEKIKNSEQLFMYETILDIQNKKQEHLDLIKGKLGDLYNVPTERLKILASLYQELSKHQEAADSYKEILVKYEPDEWSCYMGYFDNLWLLNNNSTPSNFGEIQNFIKEIQKSSSIKHKLRGPFIAEIELIYRKLNCSATIDKEEFKQFITLLLDYFKQFGNKPVFYHDVKKYLEFLETRGSKDDSVKFLESIDQLIEKNNDDTNFISKLSNYYKVQRALNLQSDFTHEKAQEIIKAILEAYSYNVNKFPLPIESERYPGDDLVLMCYFFLMDQIEKNPANKIKYSIDAASILEFGHSKSTKNFQFNLYLMTLYFEIGIHTSALSHFKILNIKNIQWDTLGYLIMDQAVRSPLCFSQSVNYFEKIFKFYAENDGTADYVAACYTNGCYSKILEIQKFQDKVANSYQKQVYSTERQLFNFMMVRLKNATNNNIAQQQLLQNCKSHIASINNDQFTITNEQLSKLSFNQDRSVYDNFNSSTFKTPAKSNNNIINSLFFDPIYSKESDCLLVLRFRRQILNLLTITTLTTDSTKYSQLLLELESTITQLNDQFSSSSNILSLILNIFKLFNLLSVLLKNYEESKYDEIKNIFNKQMDQLKELFGEASKEIREGQILGKPIGSLVSNVFEPLTWLSWVIIHLNTLVPSKKAKKKEEYHVQIRNDLEQLCETITSSLVDLSQTLNEKSLSSVSIDSITNDQKEYFGLTTNNTFQDKSAVVKQLFESNTQSTTEIQQYITCLKTIFSFSLNNIIN